MNWDDVINIINKIKFMNVGIYYKSNFWFQIETNGTNLDDGNTITIKEFHPLYGNKIHFVIFAIKKNSYILIHDFDSDSTINIQSKDFDSIEYTLTMGRPSSKMISCFTKIREILNDNNVG